ncbi:MAG: hypothetical protein ACHQWU_09945 [Gemmatimonadales bacterium]|jgi:hypothetical protein
MRTITDATGVKWTVFEVKRQGATSDRWSYLPEEFDDGWLCFESEFGKRRLTPVPSRWREAPRGELERMLKLASPVIRARYGGEDRPSAK